MSSGSRDNHCYLSVSLLFDVSFYGFFNLVNGMIQPTAIGVGFIFLFFSTPQILQRVTLNILEIAWGFIADKRSIFWV